VATTKTWTWIILKDKERRVLPSQSFVAATITSIVIDYSIFVWWQRPKIVQELKFRKVKRQSSLNPNFGGINQNILKKWFPVTKSKEFSPP
jgi:hypothetical protein